ncbi:hypothetical protein acdb102_34630 [Acidothermaceae bacterium B102]|nr:hypothetical protein acdb102_34630 [Acidothermaceae bacterium B102]
MDIDVAPRWDSVPWWLDAVHEDDAFDVPESFDDASGIGVPPLPVGVTLLAAELAGPGVEAVGLLASLAGRTMTQDQQLTLVQLWQPQLAWAAGQEQAAVAALAGPEPATAGQRRDDFEAFELAPALHTSVDYAGQKIFHARLLSGAFVATGDALRAGTLDPHRVWVMLETLTTLPTELARQVEAEILPTAARSTPSRLRRALRKAARKVDPEWDARMFATKRTTRRVGFHPEGDDGLVLMYAYLPPVEARAIEEHLKAAARVPSPDPADPRTVEEREADALITAVLGSTPGDPTTPLAPKILLQVLVSLPTLLGLREDTAELHGYGDLPPEVARELAGDAGWQRWVHDPVTGHLLDQGNTDYVPKAQLRRFVRNRDRYCQFPGSSRSADSCDLDHNEEFKHGQGGTTSAANLAALSRSPHRAKTHADHQLTANPDGTRTWTTPLGRHYTTRPHDYRPDSER